MIDAKKSRLTLMMKFNVFGQLVGVERAQGAWVTFHLGNDGKRRLGEFVVPDFIAEDEVAEYLRDLFHEWASPQNPEVTKLS